MPAATPKMEAVKLWRFDNALVLCITDSGTMGEIWNSRSVAMMTICIKWCGGKRERETRGRPSYLLFVSIRSLIQNGAGSETCELDFSACSQIACVPVEYPSGFTKKRSA